MPLHAGDTEVSRFPPMMSLWFLVAGLELPTHHDDLHFVSHVVMISHDAMSFRQSFDNDALHAS